METPMPSVVENSVRPLPSALTLIKDSFSFYREHFRVFLGIGLVPAAIAIVGILFEILLGKDVGGIIAVILGLAAWVLGFFAQLAFFQAVSENGNPEGGVIGAYKKGVAMFVPFVVVSSLSLLTIVGGAFLLFIPGIILSLLLSFCTFVLFSEGKKGISALIQSWFYSRGKLPSIFWRFLVFGIVILILSLITTAVTIVPAWNELLTQAFEEEPKIPPYIEVFNTLFTHLFFVPIGMIYTFLLYRAFKESKGSSAPTSDEEIYIRSRIKIFITTGLVGLILVILISGLFLGSFLFNYKNFTLRKSIVSPQSAFISQPFSFLFLLRGD